jgi:hypothetical protein
MRFFDSTDNKKDTLILIEIEDGKIIVEALQEYCKNNPRKAKAKKILKNMIDNWALF